MLVSNCNASNINWTVYLIVLTNNFNVQLALIDSSLIFFLDKSVIHLDIAGRSKCQKFSKVLKKEGGKLKSDQIRGKNWSKNNRIISFHQIHPCSMQRTWSRLTGRISIYNLRFSHLTCVFFKILQFPDENRRGATDNPSRGLIPERAFQSIQRYLRCQWSVSSWPTPILSIKHSFSLLLSIVFRL